MFGTGCRIGEVIGLRWEDIDEERKTININHSITYYPRRDNTYKCEYQVSLPKTEAGIRIIPMFEKVKEAFNEERRYQTQIGRENTMTVDGMSGFIFVIGMGICIIRLQSIE